MNEPVTLVAWVATTLAGVRFASDRERPPALYGVALLFGGLGIYLGGFLDRFLSTGTLLLPGDLYGLSGLALAVAGLYLAGFRPIPQLWSTVAWLTAAFLAGAAFLPAAESNLRAGDLLLTLHVGFVLAASGFLLAMATMAGLYLVKERGLRHDPRGWTRRLPRLETLARLEVRALQVGFLLLTVGIVLGTLLYVEGGGSGRMSDLLAVVTLSVWGGLALLLWQRQRGAWGGHRVALVALAIVGILVLAVALSFGFAPIRHGGAP